MADPLVHVDRHDDGVAVLRIDNPKANALSREVLRQLHAAVSTLGDDLPGALVFTGGDRIFSAGAEISEFGGPEEAAVYGGEFRQTFDAVAAFPRATIAAINGYALGGGCEMALACDIRYASSNAKLGQPEVNYGLVPGWGGTQRLARTTTLGFAKELVLTGRLVDAEEAYRRGLVAGVHDPVLDKAYDTARLTTKKGPEALAAAKALLNRALGGDHAANLQAEGEALAEVLPGAEAREGLAAFVEKRSPGFEQE